MERRDRLYMIGSRMSPITVPVPRESTRAWLSGLAVTLTTIVSYLAFWRLAPGTTFVVGCVALAGMIAAAWIYGGEKLANRRQSEKSPPQPNDPGV